MGIRLNARALNLMALKLASLRPFRAPVLYELSDRSTRIEHARKKKRNLAK